MEDTIAKAWERYWEAVKTELPISRRYIAETPAQGKA